MQLPSDFFICAQGDAKDNYEIRIKDLADSQVDTEAFPDFANLKADDMMGRLAINPFCGLKDGYDTDKDAKSQVG